MTSTEILVGWCLTYLLVGAMLVGIAVFKGTRDGW